MCAPAHRRRCVPRRLAASSSSVPGEPPKKKVVENETVEKKKRTPNKKVVKNETVEKKKRTPKKKLVEETPEYTPEDTTVNLVRRFWFAFGCWCILECSGAPLGPRTRGDAHRTRRGEGRSGAERADHDGRHAVAHGV